MRYNSITEHSNAPGRTVTTKTKNKNILTQSFFNIRLKMAAIAEEKVLSDVEVISNEKKLLHTKDDDVDEPTCNEVLDEIAAKVDSLNVIEGEQCENNQDIQAKYITTIKKQGETINTLVQQLRIIIDEYKEVNEERKYYEDLNDALMRCLEMSEGRLKVEGENNDVRTGNIEKGSNEKQSENTNEDDKLDQAMACNYSEETSKQNVKEIKDDGNDKDTESQEDEAEIEMKAMSNKELIRLNKVLLREIIEQRHQIEAMRENFRDYFCYYSADEEESEYDTATDDDYHTCEHCNGGAKIKIGNSQMKNEDDTEEYDQIEEPEKIKDETDTE